MPTNTVHTDTPDLNYAPPRVVSFDWIGESFTLFGAKPGLWIAATLTAFGLPFVVLLLLDYLLGDPMNGFYGSRPTNTSQWVVFVGIELVAFIASSFFYGALLRMAVQQVRGLPITVRDIFRGGRVFGPMTGFTLLFLLAILGLEIICFAPLLIALYSGNGALAGLFFPTASNNPAGSPNAIAPALLQGFGLIGLGLLLFLACSTVLVGLLLPGFALVADGARVGASFGRSVRGMKGHWLSAAALVFVMGLLVLVSELPVLLGLLVTMPMCFLLPALAYRDMIGMPGLVLPAPPSYDSPQAGVWPPPPTVGPPPPTIQGRPPPEDTPR